MWDTLDLVRRNLGAGSVMEVSRVVRSDFRCDEAGSLEYMGHL